MYQFQGSTSVDDQEKIIKDLEKRQFLKIGDNNKVTYFDNAENSFVLVTSGKNNLKFKASKNPSY